MAERPIDRAMRFADEMGLRVPILMAPMAGSCPPELAIAVARAGGLGACGALNLDPEGIADWVARVRAGTNGAFQLNTWIPDPAPTRDPEQEAELRIFLGKWGPPLPDDAGSSAQDDFPAQCEAMLAAGPAIVSSIMGLYPPEFVARMKQRGIRWFSTVTTVSEAIEAEAAGADVIVAQGFEAGGHRGAFRAEEAAARAVGLFALLPAVADAVKVPVVATGGIADGRGIAAALMLGASAVQIGTGLLRSPEAQIMPGWADAIGRTRPEDTLPTRAFSGRLGRSLRNAYAEAATLGGAPDPAPYPVQRSLTRPMQAAANEANDVSRMQAWAGQSAGLARAEPAAEIVRRIWSEAEAFLGA